MKIAISGSSGLLGTRLVEALEQSGHTALRLIRDPERASSAANLIYWDPYSGTIDEDALNCVDAIVNLSGAGIADGRWTADRKKILRDSRIIPTALLAETIAKYDNPPVVFVSASATGYYGDLPPERSATEYSAHGSGFLAGLCRDWEHATQPAETVGIRVVNMRIGVVLTDRGGALAKLLPIFKAGVGGKIGSGRQMMSWISITDLVRSFEFALKETGLSGPVNVVSPGAVSNAEFTEILGKVLDKPTFASVPAFAAKLAYGEMAEETVLAGAHVVPEKLTNAGFEFRHGDLEQALREILNR